MIVAVCWLGCLSLAWADGSGPSRPEAAVAVRLAPGPYFVGQAVEVTVTLTAPGGARPAASGVVVEPPQTPLADLWATEPGGLTGGSDTSPSAVARFTLVPRRAGALTIPPFRVRLGERLAGSRPTVLNVANVPATGRPPAFLGGVGPFRVAAGVEPATVRVGQPVEFRIALTGLAALGSNQSPDLAAWSDLAAAFEVRPLPDAITTGDPPRRTFRYRLRPTVAGPVVLPPVPLAAFDPGSGRFATRYTRSLPLLVTPPPRFDPASIRFAAPREPTTGRPWSWPVCLAIVAATFGGVVGGCYAVSRGLVARPSGGRAVDWRREAADLARWFRLQRRGGAVAVAEEVAARLGRLLARATGQVLAVLTPPDAEAAIRAITASGAGDQNLARRVGRLVAESDRIRFDTNTDATVGDLEEWVAEAVAVFLAIGHQAPTHPARNPPAPRSG